MAFTDLHEIGGMFAALTTKLASSDQLTLINSGSAHTEYMREYRALGGGNRKKEQTQQNQVRAASKADRAGNKRKAWLGGLIKENKERKAKLKLRLTARNGI